MRHRLRGVATVLLGAVLLGTAGLALGSWYGGRGAVPLSFDSATDIAAELLPQAELAGYRFERGFGYGVFLAPDDFGSSRATFQYGTPRADCALSDQLRRNAVSKGWPTPHPVPGGPCDGWRTEEDGLDITLSHRDTVSTLTIAPAAPDGFLATTVIGALLGATAGAVVFRWVARRRPPVPRVTRALLTVALLPGTLLTWQGLASDGLADPVWPLWRALAPLLWPLSLGTVLAVSIIWVRRRGQPDTKAPSAAAPGGVGTPVSTG
ncbi:hypothetical protein [Micromonospora chokoriensis]|uniref:Uncharacterized protein n=1 Tax=Micromonospora chokoriensis TaxID=356851 RepID=A0A1C4WHB7_9ACTN|nr:hypothetical protein [Micromonospora chokoriensis]SCE95580.1 hypothetical protein GA0070612_2478 [Micromonospora chokoriensis]